MKRRMPWLALLLTLCCMLVACGGGGIASSGVGSGGTGSAVGPVTGLASIVLDGQQDFDDAQASFLRSDASGIATTIAATQLHLGHQASLLFNAQGQVSTVTIQAQAAGLVEGITSPQKSFSVDGMRILTVSTPQGHGPITTYRGIADFSGLQLQQPVEVYGSYGEDAQGPYLLASRVTLRSQDGAHLWTGRIQSLSATSLQLYGQSTAIGLGAHARIDPAGLNLQVGELVTLHAASATSLVDAIHVYAPDASSTNITLGGVVYGLQSGGSFMVQGITVNAGSLSQGVQNGDFVQVQGSISQQQVQAQSVQVLQALDLMPVLKGSVTHYVGLNSFTVRGVSVDASQATITGTTPLGERAFVVIHGSVQGNILQANQIQVFNQAPALAIVDLRGSLQALDSTQNRLSLAVAGQTLSMQLASHLVVAGSSLSSLTPGSYVEVEAQLQSDGSYVINSISPALAPSNSSQMLQTQGAIYNYDPIQGSFMLNNLTILLNGVQIEGGSLSDGVNVEVEFSASLPHLAQSISVDQ